MLILNTLLYLKQFGLSAIKIASIDLNYYQLHEKLIKYKLPTIISTGMQTPPFLKINPLSFV